MVVPDAVARGASGGRVAGRQAVSNRGWTWYRDVDYCPPTGVHARVTPRTKGTSEDKMAPDEDKPPAAKRSNVLLGADGTSGDERPPGKDTPPATNADKAKVPANPAASTDEAQVPANDSSINGDE